MNVNVKSSFCLRKQWRRMNGTGAWGGASEFFWCNGRQSFFDVTGDECIIPPNSFALARTVEYFRIPRNVLTICLGKSTYARCGIIVNVTPLEPEWEGHVTLEFSNTTSLPAKIYSNEGVAQMLFLESDEFWVDNDIIK